MSTQVLGRLVVLAKRISCQPRLIAGRRFPPKSDSKCQIQAGRINFPPRKGLTRLADKTRRPKSEASCTVVTRYDILFSTS